MTDVLDRLSEQRDRRAQLKLERLALEETAFANVTDTLVKLAAGISASR